MRVAMAPAFADYKTSEGSAYVAQITAKNPKCTFEVAPT